MGFDLLIPQFDLLTSGEFARVVVGLNGFVATTASGDEFWRECIVEITTKSAGLVLRHCALIHGVLAGVGEKEDY